METRTTILKKQSNFSVKRIAVLSILVALCYVGRIVFQFLPNVQPMTAVLLIITLTFGTRDGLIVTALSLILSNLVLGMGPWIFYQMISYMVIIGFTGVFLRPLYRKMETKWLMVIFAFLAGLLYGFVISIFSSKMFGMTNFWSYYLMGVPFDLMHAFGNAVFYLILEPILRPLILSSMKK
ncbi:Uncharacterized membrane protein [Trichococcus flocculiformis]|uniref:ECF transporter S component n=1 Tax=Trichococcus TaxID=82802 RepID=UPI0007A9068F|nr:MULTISPECIES: ECF transporter S component [Trichococcus]CZR08926.1 ecf-type riboflavin transporter s component [Trichococcus sp. ES5]SHG08910.1 Uncharacterized membrane protein [Trichococcus flocculiformis]